MWLLLCVNFLLVECLLGAPSEAEDLTSAADAPNDLAPYNARQERFFPFLFSSDDNCMTNSNGTMGFCMSFRECRQAGGVASGACSIMMNTCCLIQLTCGGTSKANNTIFTNPDYPTANSNGGKCELTIDRINDNICQFRLDFLDMTLAQPNPQTGQCEKDVFTATGGTHNIPTLCGDNDDQHMYINVDPKGSALKLLIDTDRSEAVNRIFKIKIAQLSCDSTSKAPPGCLQYFMTTSGNLKSFNFPNEDLLDEEELPPTRQLAGLQYSICIRDEADYCSIGYRGRELQSENAKLRNFFLSGSAVDRNAMGTISAASFDDDCQDDYILVPVGFFEISSEEISSAVKFCGAAAPKPFVSTFRPFVMYVFTNDDEERDEGNFGFSLNFRQFLCQ